MKLACSPKLQKLDARSIISFSMKNYLNEMGSSTCGGLVHGKDFDVELATDSTQKFHVKI